VNLSRDNLPAAGDVKSHNRAAGWEIWRLCPVTFAFVHLFGNLMGFYSYLFQLLLVGYSWIHEEYWLNNKQINVYLLNWMWKAGSMRVRNTVAKFGVQYLEYIIRIYLDSRPIVGMCEFNSVECDHSKKVRKKTFSTPNQWINSS
jgi:hypothetical protein